MTFNMRLWLQITPWSDVVDPLPSFSLGMGRKKRVWCLLHIEHQLPIIVVVERDILGTWRMNAEFNSPQTGLTCHSAGEKHAKFI